MLTKQPKPGYKRVLGLTAKIVFITEAVGIAASYGLWYKLNTERGEFWCF